MARKRVDLADLAEDPDDLLEYGFSRTDDHSTDTVRWVHYSKFVQSDEYQLRIGVSIEFELAISDDPYVTHLQHSYSFNGVLLEIYDRRMEEVSNTCFDEDTAQPVLVGSARLCLKTLENVEQLLTLLSFRISGLLL